MGCILSFLRTGTFNFRFFGAAKRDQEKKENTGSESGETEKEKLLVKKETKRPQSFTFKDEELAASKIQAGFRGYKTRKSLKSKKKNKGGDLSLTSLTPLCNNEQKDYENHAKGMDEEALELERKRLEKVADEEIAAEIKTPLETIREESIDGSFRVKTPDVKISPVDIADRTCSGKVATSSTTSTSSAQVIALDGISEDQEKINLQEILENLSEELGNVSLDDAKTESLELEVELEQDGHNEEEESDADRKMMEQHVNEVLNAQELGEDDQTSMSLGMTDVKGASLEIHESEVETMILEENSGESDAKMEMVGHKNPDTKFDENLGNFEDVDGEKVLAAEIETALVKALRVSENLVENITETRELQLQQSNDTKFDPSIQKQTSEESETRSSEANATKAESEGSCGEMKSDDTIYNSEFNLGEEYPAENDLSQESLDSLTKSQSLHEELEDIEFIDDDEKPDKVKDKNGMNESSAGTDVAEIGNNSDQPITATTQQIPVDVEMPSLSLCERPSFAYTDSASSSATTVRPLDFHKYEDSSQDASSLSETPVQPRPKPRKPASVSFDGNKASTEEVIADSITKSSDAVVESEAPQPVLRRQRSSPKNRGKAVASKYRSGMVMDEEVSMEEMEAQIENDMLSEAATKIQAGFRGYKTRKIMGVSGRKDDGGSSGKKKAKLTSAQETSNATADDTAVAPTPSSPNATASASADNLDFMAEGKKPTLSYLKSKSYPGSHEEEYSVIENVVGSSEGAAALGGPVSPAVEMDLDPSYMNNAAIKIQASVRGYLVRKQSKKRGSRKPQQSEIPRVEFDVGGVEQETVYVDLGNDKDISNSDGGELIINPANRGMRDSVSPVSDVGSDVAATKIQAAFRGYKDRQKAKQTKKAVVTIQATVRGFLTRRRLLKLRRRSQQRRKSSSAKSMMSPEVQKIKKVNEAATKIQAVYRGYQVRSKIRKGGNDD